MSSIAGDAVFAVMSGTLVVCTHDAIVLIASSAVAKVAGPRFMPWALLAPWRRVVGSRCSCGWLWLLFWYQLGACHADELDLLAVQRRPRVVFRRLCRLQVRCYRHEGAGSCFGNWYSAIIQRHKGVLQVLGDGILCSLRHMQVERPFAGGFRSPR